jgi:hypothetical protein
MSTMPATSALGRLAYLVFYFAGGFVAAMPQTAMTLFFGTASDAQIPTLGASGAIVAVLGAYFVLYPNSRVLTFVLWLPIRIPAWFYLGGWFAVAPPQSGERCGPRDLSPETFHLLVLLPSMREILSAGAGRDRYRSISTPPARPNEVRSTRQQRLGPGLSWNRIVLRAATVQRA